MYHNSLIQLLLIPFILFFFLNFSCIILSLENLHPQTKKCKYFSVHTIHLKNILRNIYLANFGLSSFINRCY